MNINDIKNEFRQIEIEQTSAYIFACIINLIAIQTTMDDTEIKEFLEAVRRGWY